MPPHASAMRRQRETSLGDPEFFADLEAGIRLFNQREYFEAHEVWEDRWKEEAGDSRRFLQGLIQIAAGLLKIQKSSPTGAVKLLAAGTAKVKPLGDTYCGVDLKALLADADRWASKAWAMLDSGSTDYDPLQLPLIRYQKPE
jgi:predicted metal-dependent hydrolase